MTAAPTGEIYRFRASSLTGLSNGASIASINFETGGLTLTSTGSAQPKYLASGLNSKPAIRFDGTDDKLSYSAGGANFSQPLTYALVLNLAGISNTQLLAFGGSELAVSVSGQTGYQTYAGQLNSGTTVPTTGAQVIVATFDGNNSNSTIFRNGNIVTTAGNTGPGGITSGTFTVGNHNTETRPMNGDLYELIIYNRVLNATERATLNTYVYETYGIASSDATTGSTGGGTGGTTGAGGQSAGFNAAWNTRPASGAIDLNGASNQTISNKMFSNIGNDVSAIRLTNCSNMVIEQCDFANDTQGITLVGCSNITVRYNRAYNITGPHSRNGSNRANFLQAVQCGSGIYVGYNLLRDGDTEDWISFYQSNGTAANPIVIEYNRIENETYTSVSGSGIMLGDGNGTYQIARYNQMLNPGQVGIGVAGGSNISVSNNILYGDPKSTSNIAMYAADYSQTSGGMHDISFSNNRVYWKNSNNTFNPFYADPSAGTVTQSNNTYNDTTIDRSSLVVDFTTPTGSSSNAFSGVANLVGSGLIGTNGKTLVQALVALSGIGKISAQPTAGVYVANTWNSGDTITKVKMDRLEAAVVNLSTIIQSLVSK